MTQNSDPGLDTAYREGMAVAEQQTTAFLRATAAAEFGSLQVILMRDLAARLRTAGTPAEHTVRLQASADQLEAAVREIRCVLTRGQQLTG